MDISYLFKKHPSIMRPIIFILLFTGIWLIITIVMIVIENIEDFVDAHKEAFNYVFKGSV